MGICKLTGSEGAYVDAHIIPKALTRHSSPGEHFIEAGNGLRPTRKYSSWYDNALVTREGEDQLSFLDDFAITELRKHKLVWSGRAAYDELPGVKWANAEKTRGVRVIKGIDGDRLRLFFLSLLWRAAASERPEFREITLPAEDLEKIRKMIMERESNPWSYYPFYLTQFSTIGERHNHAPIATTLDITNASGVKVGVMATYRFYFDGLIAHVRRREFDETFCLEPDRTFNDDTVLLAVIPFEGSLQQRRLTEAMIEAACWPTVLRKLVAGDWDGGN